MKKVNINLCYNPATYEAPKLTVVKLISRLVICISGNVGITETEEVNYDDL